MRILIADDEANARYGMARALAGDGRELIEAEDGEQAWSLIQDVYPDLLYLDLNMPRLTGLELLQRFAQHPAISKPEIIVVTAVDTVDQAIECIRAGADDFLTKPYEVERLRAIARRAERRVAMQAQVASLQSQLAMPPGCGSLLGISSPMKQLFNRSNRSRNWGIGSSIIHETHEEHEKIYRLVFLVGQQRGNEQCRNTIQR